MVCLAAAACVFFATQIHMNILDKDGLTAAYDESRQKAGALNSSVKQAEAAYRKREDYLQRVAAAQERRLGLLNDLLELSKIDPDARALVQRWKVGARGQMQTPKGGGMPAMPAPSSAEPAVSAPSPPPAQFAPKPVDKASDAPAHRNKPSSSH